MVLETDGVLLSVERIQWDQFYIFGIHLLESDFSLHFRFFFFVDHQVWERLLWRMWQQSTADIVSWRFCSTKLFVITSRTSLSFLSFYF